MITEAEARQRVLNHVPAGPVMETTLGAALGLYAAADVTAAVALPGFDNSMMDGYAVHAADTAGGGRMHVTGEQPAGVDLHLEVGPGAAVRIFTGAPLPAGADAVIMQEDVEREGEFVRAREPVAVGENIRRAGADLCPGQFILRRGERITAGRIGVLASQGLREVFVRRPPRIGIVSTGDEVVGAGQPLRPGQVYNSNGPMLQALAAECGAEQCTLCHCGDTLEQTAAALTGQMATQDFIIISGGVSVGEHDQIKPALRALGIEPELWRVRVKPGKPFLFARVQGAEGSCFLFGLPGNPVSSFITFQLFVRPAILRWLGAVDLSPPTATIRLGAALANDGDRPHYIRGRVFEGTFTTQGLQQSHALYSLSQANALLRLETGASLAAGSEVSVWLI